MSQLDENEYEEQQALEEDVDDGAVGEQENEQEDEQQEEMAEDQAEEANMPAPGQTLQMVYRAYQEPSEKNSPDAIEAAIGEASSHASHLVREYVVQPGVDGAKVATLTNSLRTLWVGQTSPTDLRRADFMVQGPCAASKMYESGVRHTRAPLSFPRSVMVGEQSALTALDNFNKPVNWTEDQATQVRGAVARIAMPIMLGSGPMLSAKTIVAFPGICESETHPIAVADLNLSLAPFDSLECARNVAVLYGDVNVAVYTYPEYRDTLEKYGIDKSIPPTKEGGKPKSVRLEAKEGQPPLAPYFAIVHRVIGTIPEAIAILEAERNKLLQEQEAGKIDWRTQIDGATFRINELKSFMKASADDEQPTDHIELEWYAYQMLNETQAYESKIYHQALEVSKKPPLETFHTNIKELLDSNNSRTFTIDWKFAEGDEMIQAYAEMALPSVPHAVFVGLAKEYDSEQVTKRTRAGPKVPIGADRTEDHVLESEAVEDSAPPPAKKKKLPAKKPATAVAAAAQPAAQAAEKRVAFTEPLVASPPVKISGIKPSALTQTTLPAAASTLARFSAKKKAPAAAEQKEPATAAKKPAAAEEKKVVAGKKAPAAAVEKNGTPASKKAFSAAVAKKVDDAEEESQAGEVWEPPSKETAVRATAAEPTTPVNEKKRSFQESAAATPNGTAAAKAATPKAEAPKAEAPKARSAPKNRTPEQLALESRLCVILTKLKPLSEEDRFRLWGDLKTTDSNEYADVAIDAPATDMATALFDAAALFEYLGRSDLLLDAVKEEAEAAAAAPPPPPVAPKKRSNPPI